jgi:uncharacterized repeat protein (TIGR01451 family)
MCAVLLVKPKESIMKLLNILFICIILPSLSLFAMPGGGATTEYSDLSITKTADKTSYELGDEVVYTIIGKNNDGSTTDIKITDSLNSSLEFVSVSDDVNNFSCTESSGTVTCTGDNDFSTGDEVTIILKVKTKSSGSITNEATIESTSGVNDYSTSNNTASVTIDVNDLSVVQTAYDVCYLTPIEDGTRTITPINSLSDISDVVIYFDTSSLMDVLSYGKDIDACSVDDGEQWVNCEELDETSTIAIGPVSIFNNGGWSFDLGAISPDDNRSISTYNDVDFFDFFNNFLSTQGSIQASYIKDEIQYVGEVGFCGPTIGFDKSEYEINEDYTTADNVSSPMELTIQLSEAVSFDTSVTYTTREDTAKEDSDYVGISGTAEIKAGDTSIKIYVDIIHDPAIELDEYFYLDLSAINPDDSSISYGIKTTKVTIVEQDYSTVPTCYEDNFNGTLDEWRLLYSSGGFEPQIVDGRLRLTTATAALSTAVTKDYKFAAAENLITIEFDHFAYDGDGADGFALVLYDSSVGAEPQPGAFGGSLGYAQKDASSDAGVDTAGFQGGWLGLGLDEYGNYANPTEGRVGGPGSRKNAVSIRGSGSGISGYAYLAGTDTLSPVLWQSGSLYSGGRFKMTIDSRDPSKLMIKLERDSNRDGSYESVIIDNFDAIASQGNTPEYIRLAVTSSTGGSNAIHEIDDLLVKGVCRAYLAAPQDPFVTGPFDAWDTDKDVDNRVISTKIVNSEFDLTIASINSDNDAPEPKEGIDIEYRLWDFNKSIAITDWEDYNASENSDGASTTKSFNVTSASRDVKVQFKFCAESTDEGLVIKSLTGCPLSDINTSTFSSDNFAVRPYAFRVFGGDAYSRAGENFNLDIKAVDHANFVKNSGASSDVIGTPKYDAVFSDISLTSNFYTPTDSELDIMYKNVMQDQTATATPAVEKARVATCSAAGIFTKINTTDTFSDGNLTAILKFSETGILTIDINETLGKEFAIVDADDTPLSQRFILGSTTINSKTDISQNSLLLVNPYSINTFAEYNTSTSKQWIYMDDISSAATSFTKPNMSAYLHYTVVARNKDGAITQNFTSTCFPDVTEHNPILATDCPRVNGLKLNTTYDFKLVATMNSTAPVNLSIFNGDVNQNALYIDTADQDANLAVGDNSVRKATMYPKQFTNGSAESYVHFNVDKDVSTPLNPVTIKVIDANAWLSWSSSASPAAFNGTTLNTSYNYIYGRTNAPRQRLTGDSGTAFIYYEAFCSGNDANAVACNKALLPNGTLSKSTDDPRWFINTHHAVTTDGTAGVVVQKGGAGVVTAGATTGANPDEVSLSYTQATTKGYPYKTTMQNTPSSWLIYNKYNAAATTNEFDVEFINANSNWGGIHETDTTTNTNATEKTNRRTMW